MKDLFRIAIFILCLLPIHSQAAGTTEDYLCRVYMEQAMRAHEGLPKKTDADGLVTVSDATTLTITNWAIPSDRTNLYVCHNGRVCIEEPTYEYTPDTRTEDQKLDDEIAAIEKRRSNLREREQRERERKREKEVQAARQKEAERLWEKAKSECWSK